jgi:competence protein ComEC
MIAKHKGEIPFLILLIPFLLGLMNGLNTLSNGWIKWPFISVIALSILFIGLGFGYKRFGIYKIRWIGGALISLILFMAGFALILNYNELNRSDHFSKFPAKYLVVRVNSEPIAKNGYIRFKAVVEQNIDSNKKAATTNGNLLIAVKDSLAKSINYGDELLIPANYKPADPPYNPGEFNYKRYLANQNIHFEVFLFQGQYTVIATNTGNPFITYALRLRRELVAKIRLNIHDPQAAAVASTLILGYRTDLSNDVLQAYSQTGTVYVLTVSGAQVAVIYFILIWALGFLNRYKYGKVFRAVFIIGILWYYALLTGVSISVCRAVLMVSVVVIGKTFNRYINSLNVLAASAFMLLLYDPLFITDVGFQLAYLAVFGLIVFRPVIYKWLKFKNRVADRLWQLCSVSLAAQLITFPLSAFYFHQFPVYFLFSNLFAFIPATIIMACGSVYLLLPQMPVVSKCLGYVVEKTILLMNKVLSVTAHLPLASVNKIWLNTTEYLLLYAVIIGFFCYIYYRRTWLLKAGLVCILLLSISISYKSIAAIRSNSIAFLNVRKHVGIVMRKGKNAIVISDMKDTDKNYQYAIQPYLDSSKVENIRLYGTDEEIHSPIALKKYNYVVFLDKNLLIFDKHIDNIRPYEKINVGYIYLAGNPYAVLDSLDKNFSCKQLVIDAGNSNHFISMAENKARLLKLNFTTLKRNKSLVVVSN